MSMKVKIADNAVSLSNMLNIMEVRLDRADKQLFGQEVNFLWQKVQKDNILNVSSRVAITKGWQRKECNWLLFQSDIKTKDDCRYSGNSAVLYGYL